MATKPASYRPPHANAPTRPTAAARGYGHRWRKYREHYLRRHPLCIRCQRAATDVDHIIPVNGPSDPLFWPATNHQSLCGHCHKHKTAVEDCPR